MKKRTGFYPRVRVDTGRSAAVGQAGGVLLTDTVPRRGSGRGAGRGAGGRGGSRPRCTTRQGRAAIWPWRWRWAGTAWPTSRCCAREPGVFGRVASDPTVSRTIDALAADAPRRWRRSTRPGPRRARGCGRWPVTRPRTTAVDAATPLVIDLDATLVTAHSEKEQAAPTFKTRVRVPSVVGVRRPRAGRDRGAAGDLLRPGNAGSNTAADHITVARQALDAAARAPVRDPARPEGAGPRRRCRCHPRVPGLADRGNGCPTRSGSACPTDTAELLGQDPRAGVDAGLRRGRPDPRRRLGRRTHRPARPDRLAGRDAGDRPQGTTPPRRPAADHRRRRAAGHRVRHQHQPAGNCPTWSCGTAAGPAPRTGSASPKTPA